MSDKVGKMRNFMSYKDALRRADKIGASNAEGAAYIAQTASFLAPLNALNPETLYNGAMKAGIKSGLELAKLGMWELVDLALDGAA